MTCRPGRVAAREHMQEALSIYEIIGYVAAVVTIVSLTMTEVLRLRILNLAATIIWTVYGMLIAAPSVVVTNVVLACINVVVLIRILTAKEYFHLVEVKPESEFLATFLNVYEKELRRYYPGFVFQKSDRVFPFFALRNVTAAGLFIVEVRDDGRLFLILDFSTPGYQDLRIGRFVYTPGSRVLDLVREHGFKQVYSEMPGPKQEAYLRRMGFRDAGSDNLLVFDVAA